jgi:hypothetical protein
MRLSEPEADPEGKGGWGGIIKFIFKLKIYSLGYD